MGLKELRIASAERAKVREKKRKERERKNRRTHRFGRSELKPARRGVVSCMLAFGSVFFLLVLFMISYRRHGEVGILAGIFGLFALGLAVVGLIRGIEGFRERNKKYTMCKVGIVCNTLLVLFFVITYIRGYF